MTCASCRVHSNFFTHNLSPQTFWPRARSSASTVSIPRLSIIRIPLDDTRSETKRFSDSTQKRWLWRLGKKRRRVRFFACETLLPVTGRLPVTWQTRDMVEPCGSIKRVRFIPEDPEGRKSAPGSPCLSGEAYCPFQPSKNTARGRQSDGRARSHQSTAGPPPSAG